MSLFRVYVDGALVLCHQASSGSSEKQGMHSYVDCAILHLMTSICMR